MIHKRKMTGNRAIKNAIDRVAENRNKGSESNLTILPSFLISTLLLNQFALHDSPFQVFLEQYGTLKFQNSSVVDYFRFFAAS